MVFHIILFLFGLFIKISGEFTWDPELLSPRDSLLFVGETLSMKCTLPSDTSTNRSLVRFKIHNQNGEDWWLPDEDHVVDGLSILINITVTHNFTESTTVACRDRGKLLDSTFIFAENPIVSMENFSGVYQYNQNFTLSWNWAIQNKTQVDISVTLSPSDTFKENNTFPCHSVTLEGCMLPFSNLLGYPYIYVNITLTAQRWNHRPTVEYLNHLFNTSVTSIHSIYIFNNTKSGPPEQLTVLSTNSSCFTMAWKNPPYLNNCPVCSRFYAIKIQKVNEAPDVPGEVIYVNEGVPYQNSTLSLCGLEAFTEYQAALRVKREEVTPWSNPSTISLRTAEDRPLVGPPVLSTNYYVKKCVSNKRQVYIYWQAPPKATIRGELTEFKIIFNNETYRIRKESNYFLKDIECLSDSNVFIYTVNNVGESMEPSNIVVPASQTDFSEKLEFKVEELHHNTSTTLKNLTITWNSGHWKDDNATLLIYRCEEYYIANTCFDDFKVDEVRLSQQSLSLQNLNFRENFFGFALKFGNNEKQGIIWTECIFSKEAEPLKPVSLQVSPGNEDNSLYISWLATPCDRKNKVLLQYYIINICPSPDSITDCFINQKVSSTTNNFTATSLPSNKDLYVSIRAVSPYLEGKLSEPKLATIKPNVKVTAMSGIIIAICLSLGIVICIIGFVVSYRMCRKSRTKYLEFFDIKDTVSIGSKTTPQDNGLCDSSKNTTETNVTLNSSSWTDPHIYDQPNTDNSFENTSHRAHSTSFSGSENTSQETCSSYQIINVPGSETQTEQISHSVSSNLTNNTGHDSMSIDLNLLDEKRDDSVILDIDSFTKKGGLEDSHVEPNSNDILVMLVTQETGVNNPKIEAFFKDNQFFNENNQFSNEKMENSQDYISNEQNSQSLSDYVKECLHKAH